jgi:hypothetical protein
MISGSLSPRHGTSSGCAWNNGHPYGGKLRVHSSRGQLTMCGPPALDMGEVLTIPHRKMYHVTNRSHGHRTGTDSLVRPQQSETDMRFGTWNVTSQYRSNSLTAGARKLARYKLDLLGV